MKFRSFAAALPALLFGCSTPQPEGYPLSLQEAYQRLATADFEGMKMGRQCGILVHLQPFGSPYQSVSWAVTSSGREVLRFTANLVPVDAGHTKVEVVMPQDEQGREAYSGGQTYVRPAFNQPLRPAIEEQIAALLEGRRFDIMRVPRGTDDVCNIQRAGLEHGHRFSIDDDPGTDTAGTRSRRRSEAMSGGWSSPSGSWGR